MNLRFKLLFIVITFSTVFTSCKKEEEAVVSDTPKEIILPRVQGIPIGDYVPPQPQQVQPQQQIVTPNNQVVNQNQQQIVTKPGMNPPHGQPGHRCDIQVGAPLNSKPTTPSVNPGSATTQKIVTSQPKNDVPLMLDPNNNPVVTEPGMNPPHGQDGHRCDIAVGAALPKE